MRYKCLLITGIVSAMCIFFHKNANAQYLEAGIFVGAANYKGDLANNFVSSEYHNAYGMTLRYNFTKYFSVKANLLTAYISGADANFSSPTKRARNLSFRSDISEVSIQGEYSPLGFDILAGKISTPYIFAGLGGFYFNPQAELNGTWHDLRPLGTEGQGLAGGRKKYSPISFNIPVGLGFRFSLSRRVNLGFEFGARYTFTDYLDDVSREYPNMDVLYQKDPIAAHLSYRRPEVTGENLSVPVGKPRGDSGKNDLYFIGGITLSFNLTDKYGMEWEKKFRIYDENK